MSVLLIAEVSKGKVKKASLEACNYAAKIATQFNTSVTALYFGIAEAAVLSELGNMNYLFYYFLLNLAAQFLKFLLDACYTNH